MYAQELIVDDGKDQKKQEITNNKAQVFDIFRVKMIQCTFINLVFF